MLRSSLFHFCVCVFYMVVELTIIINQATCGMCGCLTMLTLYNDTAGSILSACDEVGGASDVSPHILKTFLP